MVFSAEAFRIDFVDTLRPGGTRSEPSVFAVTTFNPPIGAPLPGAWVWMP